MKSFSIDEAQHVLDDYEYLEEFVETRIREYLKTRMIKYSGCMHEFSISVDPVVAWFRDSWGEAETHRVPVKIVFATDEEFSRMMGEIVEEQEKVKAEARKKAAEKRKQIAEQKEREEYEKFLELKEKFERS